MTSEQPPERSGRHGLPAEVSAGHAAAPRAEGERLDRGDRYRDRVELSLDGRQVFFLFFGSAVLSCLLFVSGVLVGRRIEQRAAVPQPAEDPLSTLDELEGEADDGLTFPEELVQKRRSQREAREAASARSGAGKPAARDEHGPAAPAAAPTAAPSSSQPAPLPPVINPSRRDPAAAPRAAAAAAPAPSAPSLPAAAASSGRFTLQLSSFADRADAEAFAARVSGGGLAARVVESKVEGRGTFYRVRAGEYASRQAAVEAKAAYDRSHSDPAMVAPE